MEEILESEFSPIFLNYLAETNYSYHSQEEIERAEPPDAFVVIYSVVDKASFQKAEQDLIKLMDSDMLRSRPALLVANKIDLARSRAVSTQGK